MSSTASGGWKNYCMVSENMFLNNIKMVNFFEIFAGCQRIPDTLIRYTGSLLHTLVHLFSCKISFFFALQAEVIEYSCSSSVNSSCKSMLLSSACTATVFSPGSPAVCFVRQFFHAVQFRVHTANARVQSLLPSSAAVPSRLLC